MVDLVDHVTFWMPALISHITIYLHKLLENCAITTGALGRKSGGIMEVAVHIPVVFIIRILRTEQGGTKRACKMLHMELLVCKEGEQTRNRPKVYTHCMP